MNVCFPSEFSIFNAYYKLLCLQIDSEWGFPASPRLRLHSLGAVERRMNDLELGDRPPSPARLAHTSDKHARCTLNELSVLRRHRELCDVVLNVGSRKIFAHR